MFSSLPFCHPCSLSRHTYFAKNVSSRICSASQLCCRPRSTVTARPRKVAPQEARPSRVQAAKPKNHRCRQPRVGQRSHRVYQAWSFGHGRGVSPAYTHPVLSAILTSPFSTVYATLSTASLRRYPPNHLPTTSLTLIYHHHLIPVACQRMYLPSSPHDRTKGSCTRPTHCFWQLIAPVFHPFPFSPPVLPHSRSSSSKSPHRAYSPSSKSSFSPNRTSR